MRNTVMDRKMHISELCFYLFFSIMFGMRMWGIYEGKPLYIPLLAVGMLLWGMSIVLSEHSLFEYIVIGILMGLAAVIYYNSGEKGLILYFALMTGMKGISVHRLFKAGVTVGGAGLFCRSFFSAFGLIEDVAYLQARNFVGEVFRRSLGTSHPNTLSSSFTILAIMILFLVGYNSRKALKISVFILFAATYFYVYSGSRTGLFIIVGYLAINFLYVYREKIGLIEKIILLLTFPAVWGFSIVGPLLATSSLVEWIGRIDSFLRSRWIVAIYYLQNNNLSLLGQRLSNPDGQVYGIDMAQLYLFLQLGVVAFCIVTVLWIITICYEVRYNKRQELSITFIMLIMGITDPFLYNIGFKNLAFVFMGEALFFYIAMIEGFLPGLFGRKIGITALDKTVPQLAWLNGSKKKRLDFSSNRCFILLRNLLVAFSLLASIIIFLLTPDPAFVLSDCNISEHFVLGHGELTGETYSEEDIKNIEADGNIVLNYTDDNELMYLYYSSIENPIFGGYYAPNAAMMEKVRRCVSVFFWGTMIVYAVYEIATFVFGIRDGQHYSV